MAENKKNKKQEWGERLAEMLKARNISFRDAGSIGGVSATCIHNWTTGSATTNYEAVARLAKHLGTTLEHLLTGKEITLNREAPCIEEVLKPGKTIYSGLARIHIEELLPLGEKPRD